MKSMMMLLHVCLAALAVVSAQQPGTCPTIPAEINFNATAVSCNFTYSINSYIKITNYFLKEVSKLKIYDFHEQATFLGFFANNNNLIIF